LLRGRYLNNEFVDLGSFASKAELQKELSEVADGTARNASAQQVQLDWLHEAVGAAERDLALCVDESASQAATIEVLQDMLEELEGALFPRGVVVLVVVVIPVDCCGGCGYVIVARRRHGCHSCWQRIISHMIACCQKPSFAP
jgi:hypothetical protein